MDLLPLRTHNPTPGLNLTEFSAPDAMEMSKFGFFGVVPGCQAGLQLSRGNAVSDRTECTSFDRLCQIYGQG